MEKLCWENCGKQRGNCEKKIWEACGEIVDTLWENVTELWENCGNDIEQNYTSK